MLKQMTIRLTTLAFAVATSLSAYAMAEPSMPVDVQPGSLATGLESLARQYGLYVIYPSDDLKGFQTRGLRGNLSSHDAFEQLLKGTPFVLEEKDGAVLITKPRAHPSARVSAAAPSEDQLEEAQKSGPFRMAQATQGASTETTSVERNNEQAPQKESVTLQEVIVTAQKREERLRDVPMAMTVLNPEELAQNGQSRLVDYFASVPGLNLSSNQFGGGTTYITIRGLSAGYSQNPIVTTVIDDVPVTSSVQRAVGGLTSPDLDPSDLAQIEVLKGPQGTLYGANSLGGLIKYVTIEPSTSGFSGRAEVGGVNVPGGGSGATFRGAVNVPLSDTFAIRASGFYRRDPGYIDDLTRGEANFNSWDVYGGRVAALWRPLENFFVKLSALIQEAHGGISQFDSDSSGKSAHGDNNLGLTALPGTTPYLTQDQVYSANIDWKVAGLEIASVTGYVVNTLKSWDDFTGYLGSLFYNCLPPADPATCASLPSGPSVGVPFLYDITTEKFSQELRVAASIGHWLEWRLGGFYTYEKGVPERGTFYAADITTGRIIGTAEDGLDHTENFREYAIFGDLTLHVTDRFDIDLGGRQSWNKQEEQYLDTGFIVPIFDGRPSPDLGPLNEASGDAFTYSIAPRFKISPDLMVYARVATGYRIGGYNTTASVLSAAGLGIPYSFAPDKTTNYELGIKGSLLEHMLSFDAAAYYIDWNNFQVNVTTNTSEGVQLGYTANAGNAKSQGVELSFEARPLQGLTIGAQGSYNDAKLTKDIPCCSVYGLKGDQLPYSMKFSGGLTVRQDIALSKDWIGFVGAEFSYIDSRPYEFVGFPSPGQQPAPRLVYPSYTQLNLRTGAKYESWLINLYLNNATDKRGVVGVASVGNLNSPAGYAASVIQPRTIGLSISKMF